MPSRALKNINKLVNQATTIQKPEKTFLSELEITIEKEEQKNQRAPSNTYKPSSMDCIRKMYYQIVGADVEQGTMDSVITGICEIGSFRHSVLQKAITKMKSYGFDCRYIDVGKYVQSHNLDYLEVRGKQEFETKLYHKDLNLSFLCDGVLVYRKQYYILEIKTEASFKFQKRFGYDVAHELQATCYALALGIDKVMYIYENRDIPNKKTFVLYVTEEMKQKVLDLIEACNEYVATNILPPIPENANCRYCNYKGICEKGV